MDRGQLGESLTRFAEGEKDFDFRGLGVHDNKIDCGPLVACHVGINVGPHLWHPDERRHIFGTRVSCNSVKHAQLGIHGAQGAWVGDLIMTLGHSAILCDLNPYDYYLDILRHQAEARAGPAAFMPWNYRTTFQAFVNARSPQAEPAADGQHGTSLDSTESVAKPRSKWEFYNRGRFAQISIKL